MSTTVTQPETFAQVVRRLAAKARTEGSALYQDEISGRWFASSRRNPGVLHQLTAVSCTCKGFIGHGMCGHLGMLLEELAYVPDPDPDPTGAALAAPTPMRASVYDRFRRIEDRIRTDQDAGLLPAMTYALLTAPESGVDMDQVWPEDEIMAYLALGPEVSAEDVVDYLAWHRDQCRQADQFALAA